MYIVLYGWSKESIDATGLFLLEMKKFTEGRPQDIDYRQMMPFYAHVAKTAALQKKRIGGDFVISMACTSRMHKEFQRS